MPLFKSASDLSDIHATALVNITPGIYSNLAVNDVVFVAFEENALEKPIILGKLFTGATKESNIDGGMGIFDAIKVNSSATLPSTTNFSFPAITQNEYKNLKTPKKIADYILWLEKLIKKLIGQVDNNFRCFKNWVQWQFRPENIEVDDGDLDTGYHMAEPCLYQDEGKECELCGNDCIKNKTRLYQKPMSDKNYPDI